MKGNNNLIFFIVITLFSIPLHSLASKYLNAFFDYNAKNCPLSVHFKVLLAISYHLIESNDFKPEDGA